MCDSQLVGGETATEAIPDGEYTLTGETEQTADSYFIYVAIDEERNTVPVPDLIVDSERGGRLRDEALAGENGEQ